MHVGEAHVDLKPGNMFVRDCQDLMRLHCSVIDHDASQEQFAGVSLLLYDYSGIGQSIMQLQHDFKSLKLAERVGAPIHLSSSCYLFTVLRHVVQQQACD